MAIGARLEGAIQKIREAIAAAAPDIPLSSIGPDEDFIDDLSLDNLELISLSLIAEEIFSISCPESLFESARYRCAASLAEWAIRKSDEASWAESQRQRRHG